MRVPYRRLAGLMAGLLLIVAAPTAGAVGAPPAGGAPELPGGPTPELAWTARVLGPVIARADHADAAPARAALNHYTAFWRRPQKLLVLEQPWADPAGGSQWVRVRLPGKPNGSSGWIRRDHLELAPTPFRVRIVVERRRVELYRAGRRVASFRAAVGTSSTPTPLGLFAVQDPVPTDPARRRALGSHILTLTAYSTVLRTFAGGNGLVGIHGTARTGLLGRAVSHGCIRVSNRAVARLYRVAGPGTPVEIVAR